MATISTATATNNGCYNFNQDRAGFLTRDGSTLVTVFDGHGTYGEQAAIWAQEHFQGAAADIAYEEMFAGADRSIYDRLKGHLRGLRIPFVESDGALYTTGYYGAIGAPVRGGTTASAIRIGSTGAMTSAHVGDSEVRFWDCDGEGVGLCVDHSPNNIDEFLRVRASHPASQFLFGSPQGLTARPVFVPGAGSWALNPAGGCQYSDVRHSWASYFVVAGAAGREQLAMTRALGNFGMKRQGLIAKPYTAEVAAPAAGVTRAIVLASDGLWDAVQYAEVCRIVRQPEFLEPHNADGAAALLLDYGIAKSKEVFGGAAAHDNITVAVTYVTVNENVNDVPTLEEVD
jgi:serine/threonine protein phosphatase PrpC